MKLKSFLPLAVVSAGTVSCGPHSASGPATRQHDHVNFILINLDDAGNGDFSFSGALGYQTPNIDRLSSWWRGTVPAGTICERLASNIDILPTFAEIAEAEFLHAAGPTSANFTNISRSHPQARDSN